MRALTRIAKSEAVEGYTHQRCVREGQNFLALRSGMLDVFIFWGIVLVVPVVVACDFALVGGGFHACHSEAGRGVPDSG